jgi:hypothetical protein
MFRRNMLHTTPFIPKKEADDFFETLVPIVQSTCVNPEDCVAFIFIAMSQSNLITVSLFVFLSENCCSGFIIEFGLRLVW